MSLLTGIERSTIAKAFCPPAHLATLAGLIFFFAGREARAALELDGTSDAAYQALAAQYQSKALWINVQYSNATTSGSFTASAVRLNDDYVLTSGHILYSTSVNVDQITVGTGPNFETAPGIERQGSSYVFYPGYNRSNEPDAPDIAIVKLSQPLPGVDLAIAATSPGETLTAVGYGNYGTPSGGVKNQDGNARGWQAHVSAIGAAGGGYSSTYYDDMEFGFDNAGLALNGNGLDFDSGSPVFDSSGNLTGLVIASNNDNSQVGSTEYLKLSTIQDFIAQNTTVPEPVSIAWLVGGAVGGIGRRRRRRRATGVAR